MLDIFGSVLFGFGASVETKLLYDMIVKGKLPGRQQIPIALIGLTFMVIGQSLRQHKNEEVSV